MKEIRDIIKAYDEACLQKKEVALATVVHVEGSSYRRPGARMLIREDGQLTGAISGGCLEGDTMRKALLVMARQKPTLVKYDTTDDDNPLGVALGCNGIIHVFIEPVLEGDRANPIQLLRKLVSCRRAAALATVYSGSEYTGTRSLSIGTKMDSCNVGDICLEKNLLSDSAIALYNKMPLNITCNLPQGECKVFIDYIPPAVSLVVAGAGNDAMPLVEFGHISGWQPTVVDGRPNYATNARFPKAHKVIVSRPEAITSHVDFDEQTVVVLMTHNFNYDLAVLEQLIQVNVPYIGILGPHKKQEKLVNELATRGIRVTDVMKAKLFGPAGLDIGAETPEEIALSIIAEIKKVLAAGNGISLREKKQAIHERYAPKALGLQMAMK